jgi:uncharacterized protein YggE
MRITQLAFAAFAALAGSLQAQKVSIDASLRTTDKSYISASGESKISVKPDQAIVDLSVVTQDQTAAGTGAQNAKQTDALLAELRKMGFLQDQLKTTAYSLGPNYKFPKPGASPTIDGYRATNVIQVTVNNLTQLGKLIDSALQAGATNVQGLQFGLKDPQIVRAQALREAAVRAKSNAEAIASGLGLHIARILSAEEPGSDDEFGMSKRIAAAAPMQNAVPTQVEVGSIDIKATVVLKAEVVQP